MSARPHTTGHSKTKGVVHSDVRSSDQNERLLQRQGRQQRQEEPEEELERQQVQREREQREVGDAMRRRTAEEDVVCAIFTEVARSEILRLKTFHVSNSVKSIAVFRMRLYTSDVKGTLFDPKNAARQSPYKIIEFRTNREYSQQISFYQGVHQGNQVYTMDVKEGLKMEFKLLPAAIRQNFLDEDMRALEHGRVLLQYLYLIPQPKLSVPQPDLLVHQPSVKVAETRPLPKNTVQETLRVIARQMAVSIDWSDDLGVLERMSVQEPAMLMARRGDEDDDEVVYYDPSDAFPVDDNIPLSGGRRRLSILSVARSSYRHDRSHR